VSITSINVHQLTRARYIDRSDYDTAHFNTGYSSGSLIGRGFGPIVHKHGRVPAFPQRNRACTQKNTTSNRGKRPFAGWALTESPRERPIQTS
jgi:hypothetical protein